MRKRLGRRRGSTLIEFALLMPVVAAIMAGFAGASVTFLRSLQAEDLCRTAVRIAESGADLTSASARQQLFGEYGGATLSQDHAVLYVRHIVCDSGGSHFDRRYAVGNVVHWREPGEPAGSLIHLEPGEQAWVADTWIATSAIGGLAPADVHARYIQ